MNSYEDCMKRYTAEAEEAVRRFLPEETGEAAALKEAMNYSVKAGGKRLRPVLMKMTFEMFGGTGEIIFPFMAAMEMIHTHSLVHDDLPALDNDAYRRGKKTTHKVYGEAAAILAGDGLLNLAYETMTSAVCSMAKEPERMERAALACSILAGKTGHTGMLGGQSVDVAMDGKPLSKSQLEFIYQYKTGALIEAALMAGAVLAGADRQQTGVLEQVGRKVGIAFQIRDDILDVTGNEQELGKPLHSDERNSKTTYVTLAGLERARADVADLTREAMELLESLEAKHPVLPQLLWNLVQRTK